MNGGQVSRILAFYLCPSKGLFFNVFFLKTTYQTLLIKGTKNDHGLRAYRFNVGLRNDHICFNFLISCHRPIARAS